MRCPFAPWCDVTLDVNVEDAILIVFPRHAIESADPDASGMTCPGSGVRMMRSGRPHADEYARLAALMDSYAVAERARIRDEREDRSRRPILRSVQPPPTPEEIAREAAEFDDFAERAARAVEERARARNAGRDVPLARDGLGEQTIREILDDDSHRLVDRDATDADVVVHGPWAPAPDGRAIRSEDEPATNQQANVIRGKRYDETEPGFPLGRGRTAPHDAYPTGAELDPEIVDPPTPSETEDFLRGGVSFGVGPDRPVEEYYPGRPADAPEPAPGEPPAVVIPLDAPITITPLGRTAVDSAREQLIALIGATIEQIGQAQDALAKLTSQLDAADGYTSVIDQEIAAAEALLNMTIGGAGAHEKAEEIRTNLHKAKEGAVGQSDGIIAALAIAKLRSETVMLYLSGAATAAHEYSAIP